MKDPTGHEVDLSSYFDPDVAVEPAPPRAMWICECGHVEDDHTEVEIETTPYYFGGSRYYYRYPCNVPDCGCDEFTLHEERPLTRAERERSL